MPPSSAACPLEPRPRLALPAPETPGDRPSSARTGQVYRLKHDPDRSLVLACQRERPANPDATPDATDDPSNEHRATVRFMSQHENIEHIATVGLWLGRGACHQLSRPQCSRRRRRWPR